MRALIFCGLLLASVAGWGQTMVASVEPLAKLLRSLYGPSVTVQTLLDANQNPHHLALSPRQVLMVQRADLVVWLGSQAEPPLVPLIARRPGHSLALLSLLGVIRLHGDGHHEGGVQGAQGATLNTHLWLSPHNMTLLARALAARYPDGLQPGQPAAFVQALAARQVQWRQQLEPWAKRPWLSYHNPWGYLTGPLGLAEPLVVSRQLGAGPGSQRFVSLAEQVRKQQVQCAIEEPEARAGVMTKLCPDCRRQRLDPLGRDRAQVQYLPWVDSLVDGFAACLGGSEAADRH